MTSPVASRYRPNPEPVEAVHLCRFMAGLSIVLHLFFVFCVVMTAFEALSRNWRPNLSDRGAALLGLLMILPVWIRVPMLFGVAGDMIRVVFVRLLHAFDGEPDFVSPEGIRGVDYATVRLIPWDQVHSIVRVDGIATSGLEWLRSALLRLLTLRKLGLTGIAIYGPERTNMLLRLLAGRRQMLVYSSFAFRRHERHVLAAIRHYRPDLVSEARCLNLPPYRKADEMVRRQGSLRVAGALDMMGLGGSPRAAGALRRDCVRTDDVQ